MYGDRIRQLIKEQGMSQKDFAKALSIPEGTLSNWVRSSFPPLEAIEKVCSELKMPVAEFFADDTVQASEILPEERHLLRILRSCSVKDRVRLTKTLISLIEQIAPEEYRTSAEND